MVSDGDYSLVRELTPEVKDKLRKCFAQYDAQFRELGLGWIQVNTTLALAHLEKQEEGRYLLDLGSFLAVVAIGAPWWSTAEVALVEAIVRTDHGGSFRGALRGLETFARDCDVAGICIDTAAQPSVRAYSRLLRMNGYTLAGGQYFRRVSP